MKRSKCCDKPVHGVPLVAVLRSLKRSFCSGGAGCGIFPNLTLNFSHPTAGSVKTRHCPLPQRVSKRFGLNRCRSLLRMDLWGIWFWSGCVWAQVCPSAPWESLRFFTLTFGFCSTVWMIFNVCLCALAGRGANPPAQSHHCTRRQGLGARQTPRGSTDLYQTQIPPGKTIKSVFYLYVWGAKTLC